MLWKSECLKMLEKSGTENRDDSTIKLLEILNMESIYSREHEMEFC